MWRLVAVNLEVRMKKNHIILICLFVYLLSIFGAIKYTGVQYTARWPSLEPDAVDTIIVFLPVINTIYATSYLFHRYDVYGLQRINRQRN